MPPRGKSTESIVVRPIEQEERRFVVVGESPIIFNRMSEKVKRTLLIGGGRKSRAELVSKLKHDPLEEFQASVYRDQGDEGPTRLVMPAPAFKKALSAVGVDVPGAARAQLLRLSYVVGYRVPIFGVPELLCSVVRSADMAKTPDIRTRAIVRRWVSLLTVRYVVPNLNAETITNLLAAAGVIIGIGDFRQEKGAGDFGRFRLANEDDEEAQEIIAAGGREAQDAALAEPEAFDAESAELWEFAESEKKRSGKKAA